MSGLTPPNVLSYLGQVVVPFINRTFPPNDTFNDFNVPTIWIDTANENGYILVSKALGVADWVLLGGMPGTVATLTGNSGGAVAPDAGNIDVVGDGTTIDIVGNPGTSTLTVSATGSIASLYTEDSGTATPSANNLVITGGSTGLTTSGSGNTVSLTGTLNLVHGGTSATSFTANGAVISNTTTTGALSAVALSSQKFLVGTSGAPIAKAFSVVTQVFTSNGTYTPTSGMVYCIAEVLGGGGGGGGVATQAANNTAAGGGGGAGGYSRKTISAATIGASQAVTVGAGGAGGAAGSNTGATGGTTSLGAILSATGGLGGTGVGDSNGIITGGGAGGIGSSGDVNVNGIIGENGVGLFVAGVFSTPRSGAGASSPFGAGGQGSFNATAVGNNALVYGSGGGGASAINSGTQQAGGNGSAGIVIITEFVIS